VVSPALEPDSPAEHPRRRSLGWLKWVFVAGVLVLLIVEGCYLWPRMHQSWHNLKHVNWFWVAMAIWAEAVSFSAFARIQKQLLHSGGVPVSQRRSLAVIYSANSMSVTLPAGQVFSTAFLYRAMRRWGAPPLVASWELAFSGVIAAAGLALLGFGGALLGVGSVNPYTLVFSVAGLIALTWAGHYAATHPAVLDRVASWFVIRINRMRNHRDDEGMDKVREMLAQLDSVDLNRRDGLLTIVWTLGHRIGDVACLGFACYAVHGEPRWAGLMIAFAAGKAVGTVPFLPAGLGYVDATLVLTLTSAAGLPAAQAIVAAFVYRLISLILVAIIGWIVFAFLFRRHQAEHIEIDRQIDAELKR
jgi:uncharacterized protein (TIRG00374 family)